MTTAFLGELSRLEAPQHNCFLWGMISYVLFHFFVAEPAGIYQYGKGMVAEIFKFFAPLVIAAPLALPIFSILLLIALYFAPFIVKQADLSAYFLFFASFFLAMHMVLTARDLRAQDPETLKSQYFFSIALVYIISLLTIAAMLHLGLPKFSFINCITAAFTFSGQIYTAIFKQLFVP